MSELRRCIIDDFTENLLESVISRHEAREDWFSLHQKFLREMLIRNRRRISKALVPYFEANICLAQNFKGRDDAHDLAGCLQTALDQSENKGDECFQCLAYRMIFNCPPDDGDFGFLIYDSVALSISAGISETEVRNSLNDVFF